MEGKAKALRCGFAILLASILLLVFFAPNAANALCSLTLRTTDVSFAPVAPLLERQGFIYVTLLPSCDQNVEGYISFETQGEQIASKPFSYKANGFGEEVWVNWTPKTYGNTTIRITVTGDGYPTGLLDYTIFVDRDTDQDGTGDSIDMDDDNDGVPDVSDKFPLDPSRSVDTDGDGIDDAKDSDDDNDGLYDFKEKEKGTNPIKRDTDGDGVFDDKDAFPSNPKKTSERITSTLSAVNMVESDTVIATTTQGTDEEVEETPPEIVLEKPNVRVTAKSNAVSSEEATETNKSAIALWTIAISSTLLAAVFYAKYLKARG